MAAFGHQQRQVDAGFGEVRQGGVAQLVQRPARLADLQRAVLEQVCGSFVGEPATTGDRAQVQRGGRAGGAGPPVGEEDRPGIAVADQSGQQPC
jgi:hypothetical protein